MKSVSPFRSLLNEKRQNVIEVLAFAHPVAKYAAILLLCLVCYLPAVNAQPLHEPIDYCKEIPRNTAALPVGTQFVDRWGYPWIQDTSGIGNRSAGFGEVQCGSFILAFADVAQQTQRGFDDRLVVTLPANHPLGSTSTLGELRRWTSCQVFAYISQQIVIPSGTSPDIYFAISDTSGSGGLAAASPFFAVPGVPAFVGGFLQEHIVTGINPTPNSGDYDAKITCDFGQNNQWGFNGDTVAINSDGFVQNSGDIDLYSVLLHQATHALGFFSAIQSNGKSILTNTSPGTYSLMDQYFTDSAGTKLIDSSFLFNVDTLQLIGNGLNFTDTNNTVGYPIYSPTSWHKGSSLNHYDNNRDNTPFVIAPQYEFGDRRDYSNAELEAFLRLDYRAVKPVGNPDFNFRAIPGQPATPIVLPVVGSNFISYNVVLNDKGINNKPVTIARVKIINGDGIAVIDPNFNSTNILYTISSGQFCGGNVLVSYTPESDGVLGEPTTFTIFVDCPGYYPKDPCNMVPNGTFEDGISSTDFEAIVNSNYWDQTIRYGGAPGWLNGGNGTSDAYFRGSTAHNKRLRIPDNYIANFLQVETTDALTNHRYAGMYSGAPTAFNEKIYCRLTMPLVANKKYRVSYQARTVPKPGITNSSNDAYITTSFIAGVPSFTGNSYTTGTVFSISNTILQNPPTASEYPGAPLKWTDPNAGPPANNRTSFIVNSGSLSGLDYFIIQPSSPTANGVSGYAPYVFIDNVKVERYLVDAAGPAKQICKGSTPITIGLDGPYETGMTYSWASSTNEAGFPKATPEINVSPVTTTTYTLTMVYMSVCTYTSTCTVSVLPLPTPNITASNQPTCPDSPESPGADPCLRACVNTEIIYSPVATTGSTGSTFNWSTIPATIAIVTPLSGGRLKVKWLNPGLYSITVNETSSDGCIGSTTRCVRVLDIPNASFYELSNPSLENLTICKGSLLTFINTSTTNQTYKWVFKDDVTIITTTSYNAPAVNHKFNTVGDYAVVLSVFNDCGCSSTYEMKIHVVDQQSVQIVCNGVKCEFEKVTYSLADPEVACPSSLGWNVLGGTIANNFGVSINVLWDNVPDDGFGVVTFDPAGCLSCLNGAVSIRVPVIKQKGVIVGNRRVCIGSRTKYSLPTWPGTKFIWACADPNIVLTATDQPNEILVEQSIPVPGSLKFPLICNYFSELADCGGDAELTIDFQDPILLNPGDGLTLCQDDKITYSLPGASPDWMWVVTPPSGTFPTPPISTDLTISSLFPGTYNISIKEVSPRTPLNFCPPPSFTLNVLPKPSDVDFIANASGTPITGFTGCNGVVYTFEAGNDKPGTSYFWTVTGGQIQGSATGKRVSVIFTGLSSSSGATVSVQRVTTESPYCTGDTRVITVNDLNINFTIQSTHLITTPVCPNTQTNYWTTYTEGETYEWSIADQNKGSVVSGNGTPYVTVLWNNNLQNNSSTDVVLKIRKCEKEKRETFHVLINNPPPAFQITFSNSPVCGGANTVFTIGTTAPATVFSASSIRWDFADGTAASTGAVSGSASYTQSHAYSTSISGGRLVARLYGVNGICNATAEAVIDPLTITILPAPAPVFAPTGRLCTDKGPYTFTVDPGSLASGDVVTWLGNATGTTVNSYGPTNVLGAYYVKVTNTTTGCSTTTMQSEIINCNQPCNTVINAVPTATANMPNCGLVTLTGLSNVITGLTVVSQDWLLPASAISSPPVNSGTVSSVLSARITQPGTHSFTYRVGYKTSPTSPICYRDAIVNVYVPALPALSYTINCTGGSYQATLSAGNGTISSYNYSVTPSGGSTTTTNSGSPVHNVNLLPGVAYTFNLSVSTTAGTCQLAAPLNLAALPLPPGADFTMDVNTPATPTICAGVPVLFTHSGAANPALTYKWDFGDQTTSLVEYPGRVYQGNGSRLVTLTTTNSFGCMASVTKPLNIVVNPLDGVLAPSSDVFCLGSPPIPLQYIIGSVNSIPTIYQWHDGTNLATGAITNPTYTATQSGYYWLHGEDANKCYVNTVGVPVSVIQLDQPVITTPNSTVCLNQPFTLSAFVGDPAGVTYQWELVSGPGGSSSFGINEPKLDLPGLTVPGVYEYKVTATLNTPLTCSSESALFPITVPVPPATPVINAPFVKPPVAINCDAYNITLSISSPLSTGAYEWSNRTTGPNTTVNTGGIYTVRYTAATGCASLPASIVVPSDPRNYLWTFPDGCYNKICIPDPGGIHIYGPVIPFSYWAWSYNNNLTSGTGPVNDLVVHTPGAYTLTLDNGLCRATSDVMQISSPPQCLPDESCDDFVTNFQPSSVQVQPGCSGLSFSFDIQNLSANGISFYLTCTQATNLLFGSFTLSTQYVAPGTTTVNATWTAPAGFNHQPVTFYIHFITREGCQKILKYWEVPCNGHRSMLSKTLEAPDSDSLATLTIAPNPAGNNTRIGYFFGSTTASKRSIEIFDATGRKINAFKIDNRQGSHVLNTASYPAGLYHVVLIQNGAVYRKGKLAISR